jgi:hypothetical protein
LSLFSGDAESLLTLTGTSGWSFENGEGLRFSGESKERLALGLDPERCEVIVLGVIDLSGE